MLTPYKRKMKIAGIAYVAGLAPMILAFAIDPGWLSWSAVVPDAIRQSSQYLLLLYLLFLGASGGVFCWAMAKAKGYAGWVGIVLLALHGLGFVILLCLPDKTTEHYRMREAARLHSVLGDRVPLSGNPFEQTSD